MIYRYLMTLRPPGPGCQPKDGLVQTFDDRVIVGDTVYHGVVTYNRKLTDKEVSDYELKFHDTFDE